jgi:hypothetical protein
MIPSRLASLLLATVLVGCAAVYPELGTRTRPIPAGRPLDPPPPVELRWIKILGATIPEHTRDGRTWQANGKASAYAKILVNGSEILKTNTESDTLTPTWAGSPRGNYKIAPGDKIRVELWDSNPINDKPIGSRELGQAGEIRALDGRIHVDFEEGVQSAGSIDIAFELAHAVNGLGLWYELRTAGCWITRLLPLSPAERAGLKGGDELLKIGGREAKAMSVEELKSAFNAVPMDGLKVVIKHDGGAVAEALLKEGPIYATFADIGPID